MARLVSHTTAAPPTPDLSFSIEGADAVWPAAVPTLGFTVAIEATPGLAIRTVMLDVQIQIAARQRPYAPVEQKHLLELFGTPERWGTTLRTLPWLRTTVVVPPFEAQTTVPVTVACTYDLELTATRYFAALAGGEIPLQFLFSGSTFYVGPHGALQTTRIGWDTDADYRLPVTVWRAAIDRHFPDHGWLRCRTATLARLSAYKARHAHVSWDDAIDALLGAEDDT
jgi:hypothetical protein